MESSGAEPVDFESLLAAANALTTAQVDRLEAQLETDIENERVRGLLLAYFARGSMPNNEDAERRAYCERSLERLLEWVIEHHPERQQARFSFWAASRDRARRPSWVLAWRRVVKRTPEDVRVLKNAAFFHSFNHEMALPLLEKARKLAPHDPEVLRSLAIHVRFQPRGNERAADLLEQALALATTPEQRRTDLQLLASAALRADQLPRAESAARESLSLSVGDATPGADTSVHEAWNIAGKCALHRDDVEEAKRCLIAAAELRPGAVLVTWPGPRMELAERLLSRGERDAVLEYLRRLRTPRAAEVPSKDNDDFASKLGIWISAIESGGVPDFGEYARE